MFQVRWAISDIFMEIWLLKVTYQPSAFTRGWWGRCFCHLYLVINLLISLLLWRSSWVFNVPSSPESTFNFLTLRSRVCLAHVTELQLLQDTHTTKMGVNKTAMCSGSSLRAPVGLWSVPLYLHLPFPTAFHGVSESDAKTKVLQRQFNELLGHELLQVKSL